MSLTYKGLQYTSHFLLIRSDSHDVLTRVLVCRCPTGPGFLRLNYDRDRRVNIAWVGPLREYLCPF